MKGRFLLVIGIAIAIMLMGITNAQSAGRVELPREPECSVEDQWNITTQYRVITSVQGEPLAFTFDYHSIAVCAADVDTTEAEWRENGILIEGDFMRGKIRILPSDLIGPITMLPRIGPHDEPRRKQ